MFYDRTVNVSFGNKRVDSFKFLVRHEIYQDSRKGITFMVVDLPVSNPIYTCRTDQHDGYDRRKGTLVLLQKFLWRHYEWKEQATYDIDAFKFNKDGSIDLDVKIRSNEPEGMWWLNRNITTGERLA